MRELETGCGVEPHARDAIMNVTSKTGEHTGRLVGAPVQRLEVGGAVPLDHCGLVRRRRRVDREDVYEGHVPIVDGPTSTAMPKATLQGKVCWTANRRSRPPARCCRRRLRDIGCN